MTDINALIERLDTVWQYLKTANMEILAANCDAAAAALREMAERIETLNTAWCIKCDKAADDDCDNAGHPFCSLIAKIEKQAARIAELEQAAAALRKMTDQIDAAHTIITERTRVCNSHAEQIATLQAENERLRAALESERSKPTVSQMVREYTQKPVD